MQLIWSKLLTPSVTLGSSNTKPCFPGQGRWRNPRSRPLETLQLGNPTTAHTLMISPQQVMKQLRPKPNSKLNDQSLTKTKNWAMANTGSSKLRVWNADFFSLLAVVSLGTVILLPKQSKCQTQKTFGNWSQHTTPTIHAPVGLTFVGS